MKTSWLRPTTVEINENAIFDNVSQEIQRLDQGTVLFAVVKANAYGHGVLEVARVCRLAGAQGFCVATLDEGLELREAGFTEPILVLGILPPEYAALAATQHISLTVGSYDWLEAATTYLETVTWPLTVHLAVDSGMGRIGFVDPQQLKQAEHYLATHDHFQFEGIFTHFATADDPDTTYFHQQVAQFKKMLAVLSKRPRYVHVSNSATSLWHSECNGNMVRFGIALYGLNPSGTAIATTPYTLTPAASLRSQLVFVKQVPAGTAISYGATYKTSTSEWIGTVPIGYADGWLRRLSGMQVLINGQRCPIVGRVCMDQVMVRLPEALPVGTTVTLVGKDGDDEITWQEVADYAHTIHYEILCNLTDRLPRMYQSLTRK